MPQKCHTDLIKHFIRSVINTSATAETIKSSPENLNEVLLSLCRNEDTVLLALPGKNKENLFSIFKKNKKIISSPSNDQLSTINTGVTFAFAAVASTGSVCISMDDNLTAPISILIKNHITIVDGTSITERPSDLFKQKTETYGSFSFITGPSATADMGPLVRGVHGPGKLHIIVLE